MDAAPIKPSLRGVVHQWSFFAAVAGTAYLLVLADTGREAAAAAIYGATLCGLLGTSALYHRVTWQERSRRMMRRLDHSMIFLLIAGTYTPFALVVLSEPLATIVLVIVWAGALAGVVITFAWIDAPKPLVAAVCVALGWVAVATMPQLVDRAGWGSMLAAADGGREVAAVAIYGATLCGLLGTSALYHRVTWDERRRRLMRRPGRPSGSRPTARSVCGGMAPRSTSSSTMSRSTSRRRATVRPSTSKAPRSPFWARSSSPSSR